MWDKTIWMEHRMRLIFTRKGLLEYIANHYTNRDAQIELISNLVSFLFA